MAVVDPVAKSGSAAAGVTAAKTRLADSEVNMPRRQAYEICVRQPNLP
jgi:hypothetical protein